MQTTKETTIFRPPPLVMCILGVIGVIFLVKVLIINTLKKSTGVIRITPKGFFITPKGFFITPNTLFFDINYSEFNQIQQKPLLLI